MDSGRQWEHLRNAPITEALIDIRAKLPPRIGFSDLTELRNQVMNEYPSCRERRRIHGVLSFKASDPPALNATQDTPDGYLMASADGRQIVQIRLDGFTFSRLKPYETWEALRDEAEALWTRYRQALNQPRVSRIAVRYINRIEIPTPMGDLKDWILTGPDLAPGLPQQLAGYFFRIHMPFEDPSGFVNIIQKIDIPTDSEPNTVPLILDIDAFHPVEDKTPEQRIWELLEDLRKIKNRVFFDSVTERALELFR